MSSQRISLRGFMPALMLACLAGCGGGGDGNSQPSSQASNPAPSSATTATSPAPVGGVSIKASDILGQASGNAPFAQQSGWNAQVLGQYPTAQQIPETGINGTLLPNGETVRFGKESDPTDATKQAIVVQLAPTDPVTSGSHRSEIEMPPTVVNGRTYWLAVRVFVPDWGTLPNGDEALFGAQLHAGNSNLGYSPSFTLATYGATSGGRTFQVFRTYTDSSGRQIGYKYPEIPIPFNQWTTFIFKFRHALDATGLLQVWMNDNQIVDYGGPIGWNTPGYQDYAKFGYYNWTNFSTSRKVLLGSPVLVSDPTGSTYQETDLNAFVQANE